MPVSPLCLRELQTAPNAPWKIRYRTPMIWNVQIAPHAPQRGLVASTRSGALQWYAWDLSSGALRQLTDRPGGMATQLRLAPDGEYIYYLDDQGVGNEIGHYLRLPYAGGAAVDITPDLPPYSSWYLDTCLTGDRLGYMCADQTGFHIYTQEIVGGAPADRKELFHSPRLTIGPFHSADGGLALIMSTDRAQKPQYSLLAFDTQSGHQVAELWDGDKFSVEMRSPSPVPGDPRFLATTNRTGTETLLIWDPQSGVRTDLVFPNLTGSVTAADWSPDGQQIVFSLLHQAVQQLYLHDLASGTTIALQPPPGTNSNPFFTPDGKAILTLWEDSTHPPQLIKLDPKTGLQTEVLIKGGEVPAGQPWRWVSFPSTGGQNIQGWLATPPGKGPFPTVLETHGGPEGAVTNSYSPGAQAWLDHGFAFLTINYHGSTTFGRQFQESIWGNPGEWEVEDMVAARSWLVELGIAHPEQVFLTGWSYGGYLTLQALGKYPKHWACGLAGIAIADWKVQYEDCAESLRGYQEALFHGTPATKPEQYAKSSPITYAENIAAPVLIIQGRNDTRTPARPVEMYEAKLKALGKPIEVFWFDSGHAGSGSNIEQSIGFQEKMMSFAFQSLQS
jgi:dipeptidyl aminopeptidase/acylaminoacyl peptidase